MMRRGYGWLRAAKRRLTGPRPLILMYHRVAELANDPWGLAVPPRQFAAQLDYLVAHRHPMRMEEFVRRLAARSLPRDAVAITFDDGYRDNLDHAMPLLSDRGLPATLFVTTGAIARPGPFWWDELARLVLDNPRAARTVVDVAGQAFPLAWDAGLRPTSWRAWQPPQDARQAAFVAVWAALRATSEASRRSAMDDLRRTLGTVEVDMDRSMTRSEMQRLVADGSFELGAHSVTHPALTTLEPDVRRTEIEISRRECSELAGSTVNGFAYPYGDLNDAVRDEVAACGFAWACTTEGSAVDPERADPYRLPRLAVNGCEPDAFAAALAVA